MTSKAPDFKDTNINMAGGLLPLFPTTCFRRQLTGEPIDKMNEELRRLILEMEKKEQGSKENSIKGGFHSHNKFFEEDNWAVKQLGQLIHKNLAEYVKEFWKNESTVPFEKLEPFEIRMWGWATLIREGGFSAPHIHPNANISGVYYPYIGEIEESDIPNAGCLALCDPRIRAHVSVITGGSETIKIAPLVGSLVAFPSYLEHYVVPFKGKSERISISFNTLFPDKARMVGSAVKD